MTAGPIRKVGEIGGKVGKQVGRIGEKVGELGEDTLHAVEGLGHGVVRGIRRLTRLHFPQRESDRPLKHSKTGYETETFVLDAQGRVTRADALLKLARAKGIPVAEEAARSQVEVLCLPHAQHRVTSRWMVNNLIELSELAEKRGLALFPGATYPGRQEPQIRSKPRYRLQQRMLGEENFKISGMCCGYHQHYTLPRGLFDEQRKRLRYTTTSKVRRTLLDSHNFLVAADPALTCLLQSSPFAQGKYLAKDSRMLLYRGGSALRYPGLYGPYPRMGQLQPYQHTLYDLISTLDANYDSWSRLAKAAGHRNADPQRALSYAWTPIKINPKGTLEYRGTDMNFASNIFAVSAIIAFSLRRIQQDFTLVAPLDIELRDAFKTEGNMLFIPAHTLVRQRLQRASAYEGFEDRELRTYVSRLYRFAREEIARTDPDSLALLKPVSRMIDDERTLSDEMVAQARKDGYRKTLPQEYAQELALRYSERFSKDLRDAKAVLEKTAMYE